MANSKTNSKKKTTSSSSTAAKKNTTKTASTKKATTKTAANKKTTAKKVTVKAQSKKVPAKTSAKKVETVKAESKKTNVKKNDIKANANQARNSKKIEKINIIDWCKENYTIIGLVLLAILLIINIVIVSLGHKVKLSNGKEIIASVDGKQFLADDLFDDLKNKYGSDVLLNMIDEFIVGKEVTDEEKVEAKKSAQENIDSIKEQYTSAGYKWEDILSQYGYANEDVLLNEMLVSVEKEIVAKNYIKKDISEDEIKKYYDENDDKQAWFDKIKALAVEMGYAGEVKEFKANPGMYKAHVGDVSTAIRVALTSRTNTPDMYEIMQVLGKEKVAKRLEKAS